MMVYYINLASRPDKNKFILDQKVGYKLFRIEAESKLSEHSIQKNTHFLQQDEVYLCLISHIKAMKEGLKGEHDFFWIAEDDACLPEEEDLELVQKELPKEVEVVQCCVLSVEAIENGTKELRKGQLFMPWKKGYKSTALYGIRRKSAIKFVEQWDSLDFRQERNIHADYFIYEQLHTVTITYLLAITTDQFTSDISKNHRIIFDEPLSIAFQKQEQTKVLFDLFKLKDKKVYYVINIGNAGDALINHSTIEYFDLIGLNYEVIQVKDAIQLKDQILIYGGGGNLVKYYSQCKSFLEKTAHQNKIILLPCTVDGHQELLKKLDSNITIYCRERTSYQYLKSINNKLNVHISEDMAFRYLPTVHQQKGDGVLEAFRNDVEATRIKGRNDISLTLNTSSWWRDIHKAKPIVDNFLKFINYYSEIHTNRLHIAIAASLLNKKVILYPNSYFKNKAVYQFSLSNNQNTKLKTDGI